MSRMSLNLPGRWDPFRELQREMGRLFESFETLSDPRGRRAFPAVNLYDVGDKYVLTTELPGLAAEELDISMTGETLTLRGERKRSESISDESYRRQERGFGTWSRTLTLPDRVDSTQVSAALQHGILTVTLPKAAEAKPRQIMVQAGE